MFDPKKLGEEADQMIQELNQKIDAAAQPASEEQSGEPTEAIAQEVVDAQPDDQGVESTAQSVEQGAVEATDAPASSAELELLKKQVEASEQKWRVLQGMINKKDDEIESLRALFAQINAAPQGEATAEPARRVEDLVTKKDVDDYGSDLVDFVRRAAQSVLAAEMARLETRLQGEVDKLRSSVSVVEQTSVKAAQDVFFDSLTKRVPDWKALNTDPTFLAWLSEVDPFAGTPRLQLLQNAVGSGDAERASMFFSTYKAMTQPAEPVAAPAPQVADAAAQRSKVERFVSPGKSKGSTAKVEGDKPVWTRAAIARLYDDKMAGKISAKKFEEFERDIFAAQQEGRIAA
jgi:hypothetical protein